MRQSKQNNSKFSRFAYYKYSGIIVFAPIIILAVIGYVYMSTEQEFFSAWSCDTINDYLLQIDIPEDMIQHNDLTDEQHLKLHEIHQECVDATPFTTNEHK